MRIWLADGVEQIGLCEQAEFPAIARDGGNLSWQRRVDLGDAWQAEAFVQFHLRDRLFELRAMLARQTLLIHRLSDEQVLHQVANELQFGNLRADRYAWRAQVITHAAEAVTVVAAPAPPAPQPERVEAVVPVAVAKEAPVTSPAQAEAQDTLAAMLEQAAQEAAPFCEACELAKAQPAAALAAVEPTAAEQVQDAQAQVLEQAAQQAMPFCEICEQAKAQAPAVADPVQQPIEAVQDAQAAVLEQAAERGTPFWEICEGKR